MYDDEDDVAAETELETDDGEDNGEDDEKCVDCDEEDWKDC